MTRGSKERFQLVESNKGDNKGVSMKPIIGYLVCAVVGVVCLIALPAKEGVDTLRLAGLAMCLGSGAGIFHEVRNARKQRVRVRKDR